MKKWFVLILLFTLIAERQTIYNWFVPPPDYSQLHPGKVILYATEWCGYCAKTRQFMDRANIPYVEYDIEKSSEGKRQYDALGARGVPVLLVKGEVVVGYDPRRIVAILDRPDPVEASTTMPTGATP